jgi:hypothetical protein
VKEKDMRNPFVLNRRGVLVDKVNKMKLKHFSVTVMVINMVIMACMLYFLIAMQTDVRRMTVLSTGEGEVVTGTPRFYYEDGDMDAD